MRSYFIFGNVETDGGAMRNVNGLADYDPSELNQYFGHEAAVVMLLNDRGFYSACFLAYTRGKYRPVCVVVYT